MINRERLVKELEECLKAHRWDIWMTVTFRYTISDERSLKWLKWELAHLNTPNEIFFHKFLLLWIFTEWSVEKGIHLHAVVKGLNPLLAPQVERKFKDLFGQSKVVPYDHSLKEPKTATHYLALKILSPKLIDYNFYRINSRYRRTQDDKEYFNAS